MSAYPPQARGWTLDKVFRELFTLVSPAGAGMDRTNTPGIGYMTCIPRRRGDGPECRVAPGRQHQYPPQARGWTRDGGTGSVRAAVSPAGAGMDRDRDTIPVSVTRIPRRRGDGPGANGAPHIHNMYPPQARGWTAAYIRSKYVRHVSPAGAGMDPLRANWQSHCESIPRRRGDGPVDGVIAGRHKWYPPQARGWTRGSPRIGRFQPVSPAGAGMDLVQRHVEEPADGIPRRRGDGPWPQDLFVTLNAYPPQARGWTLSAEFAILGVYVSPAGAGMDLWRACPAHSRTRIPRRRGDGPQTGQGYARRVSYPPQARGWTCGINARRIRGRVSPAGAGMDPSYRSGLATPACIPRRRGDGP